MTPNAPHRVVITVSGNGTPVANPSTVEAKQGQSILFKGAGGVGDFELDFHESPESGGREKFASRNGEVKIRIKQVDEDKYPPGLADKSRWKKIKYDVVVAGQRLDPEVIIDPN